MDNKKRLENLRRAQNVSRTAFFLESVIVVFKVVIGILSGSLVLISDAIHSASDILSIATSWFGLKIAQKESSERFAYGYYKAESLGALFISVLILYGFWNMITRGVSALSSSSEVSIPYFALAISFLDALILFFFGKYEIKVGRETGAQSLVAMGKENRTHIFSSGAVFIGILAAYFEIPYIEGIITIGISLLILEIGLEALKDSVFNLMDVSPSKEIEKEVSNAIDSVPGVEESLDLRLRKSGAFIFGQASVGVRKYVDVNRANEIADRVEKKVKEAVPKIDSFVVRVEPFRSEYHHLAFPVEEKNGLNSKISKKFGRAPYFLFVNLRGSEIEGHYIVENPYQNKEVRAGLSASNILIDQKIGSLIVSDIGEISFYTLRDNLIDVYRYGGDNTHEALDKYMKENLERVRKPSKVAEI